MFQIQTELAWAAGFFDGEGCVSVSGVEYRVAIGQTDPRPLERFVEAVGRGKVNGPYPSKNPKHKDQWQIMYSTTSARLVLEALWPYMSDPKKEQARKQWDKYLGNRKWFSSRQELTRGKNGHLVPIGM